MSCYDEIVNLTTHQNHYDNVKLERAFHEGFKYARNKAAEIIQKDEKRILELENDKN